MRYNRPAFERRLSRFEPGWCAVFAAACAERFRPAFESLHQSIGRRDASVIEALLGQLWRHVLGEQTLGDAELRAAAETAEQATMVGSQSLPLGAPSADAACVATACAFRALVEAPVEAMMRASERSYAAASDHVRIGLGLGDGDAANDHPVIQRELGRQVADFHVLIRAEGELTDRFRFLRDRALDDAKSTFDVGS